MRGLSKSRWTCGTPGRRHHPEPPAPWTPSVSAAAAPPAPPRNPPPPILNSVLAADRCELFAVEQLSGHPVFKVRPATTGVAGRPKNLIFASTGPKPELGFADAVNNDIVILRHAEHCLVYDEPIGDEGLRWTRLVEWWAARNKADPKTRRRESNPSPTRRPSPLSAPLPVM
ncbi:MAG: hypothetical protein IPL61_06460 [Myxococcales bacterium]|nr:hypothetical protein [Myxococcales bacterium]